MFYFNLMKIKRIFYNVNALKYTLLKRRIKFLIFMRSHYFFFYFKFTL